MASALVSELLAFLDGSPSPYHAVQHATSQLDTMGFRRLDEADPWSVAPGDRVYVSRADASLAAFALGELPPAEGGFQLIGAHTDSPNLRLKPNAAVSRYGYRQLGVEVYGAVLLHTWLDRDLSIAGKVTLEEHGKTRTVLVDAVAPVVRIPSLAIHLNRAVNVEGLKLNAQSHIVPVSGLEETGFSLESWLAQTLVTAGHETTIDQILGFELGLYDVQKASVGGAGDEFIFSARLDNLAGCFAALRALSNVTAPAPFTRGIILYDHEEVGSRSAQGADSTFLEQALLRLCHATADASPDALPRALARSFLVSCDTAHAVHPNYADMHDPNHRPVLGRGPVIKRHASQAYATDAESHARFVQWCRRAEVSPQHFVTRSDLGCGSTIGPITASRLGLPTVDVGHPLLSMHSIREMAANADIAAMQRVLNCYFSAED